MQVLKHRHTTLVTGTGNVMDAAIISGITGASTAIGNKLGGTVGAIMGSSFGSAMGNLIANHKYDIANMVMNVTGIIGDHELKGLPQ